MQKIFISFLVIFISINLKAQDKNFKSFYKTYKKDKNIIGISVPISFANYFIDRKENELKNTVKKGKKVRILIFDEVADSFKKDINTYLPAKEYQEFVFIKDKGSTIRVLVRDTSDYISEIIFLIRDNNSLYATGIFGKFSYDDLKELSDSFQI